MICLALRHNYIKSNPIFDTLFKCRTDKDSLFLGAVEKDTTAVVLTDEFIEEELSDTELLDLVKLIQATAPEVKIIICAKYKKFDITGVSILKVDWRYPEELLALADKVHLLRGSVATTLDRKLINKFTKQANSSEDNFLKYVSFNTKEACYVVKQLLQYYQNKYSSLLNFSKEIESANLVNFNLKKENNILKEELQIKNELLNTVNNTNQELVNLMNKNNIYYKQPTDAKELLNINFRKILYIKEVTNVRFMSSLVYYLNEILNTKMNNSCRVLVIENSGRDNIIDIKYPTYVPHSQANIYSVAKGNIVMSGYQSDILDVILTNKYKFDNLIILDRTGRDNLFISNPHIRTLYTFSDLHDNHLEIPEEDIISYSTETMHIPYNKDFNELSNQEKIIYYSSLDIVKNICKEML